MKTCTKNLIYWAVATVLLFGGMIYLVSITESVGAEKEPEKDYTQVFEAIVERDENRETRAILRNEISQKYERIAELEARADELNTIINGEQGLK